MIACRWNLVGCTDCESSKVGFDIIEDRNRHDGMAAGQQLKASQASAKLRLPLRYPQLLTGSEAGENYNV